MSGSALPNLFDFRLSKNYDTCAVSLCRRASEFRVAIQRLLQQAAFGPDEIRRLSAAYDAALDLLRLKDRNDPICELIAAKIIQVYRLGESDPPRLCARAIKELGVPLPD
jgi:hypothetical protein